MTSNDIRLLIVSTFLCVPIGLSDNKTDARHAKSERDASSRKRSVAAKYPECEGESYNLLLHDVNISTKRRTLRTI